MTAGLMVACGGGDGGREGGGGKKGESNNDPNDADDNPTSSLSFGLSGANFAGNSIRICGARNKAADAKYRCASELGNNSKWGDSKSCPCFNFDDDGRLIDPSTGQEVEIDGLCPSDNFPSADWTFNYTIYGAQFCKGTQINDSKHNFTCYDEHDLGKKNHPNKSVEALVRGENVNQIVCLTENARKSWSFDSCAVVPTSDNSKKYSVSRYDCGCTSICKDKGCASKKGMPACECPGGLSDLPSNCSFDPSSCDVVCSGP